MMSTITARPVSYTHLIYDMSYLEMNLAVDELKIRSLKPGQTVEIRADAVPGEVYTLSLIHI